jgi:hypothetical protein
VIQCLAALTYLNRAARTKCKYFFIKLIKRENIFTAASQIPDKTRQQKPAKRGLRHSHHNLVDLLAA